MPRKTGLRVKSSVIVRSACRKRPVAGHLELDGQPGQRSALRLVMTFGQLTNRFDPVLAEKDQIAVRWRDQKRR